jgi:hypothetical protein
MILMAAASRLIPHPPNFTAIGALALFGGAQLRNRGTAALVPISALFLSDLVLGFHSLMPCVYGSFILSVCLGFWIRRDSKISRVALATLACSVQFYFVTNFCVWLKLGTYPLTTMGLVECYVAGLPFLVNTVLGDLFYGSVLFGSLALAEQRFIWLRPRAATRGNFGSI